MGYKHQRKQFQLKFTEPELQDFEVFATRTSMEKMIEFQEHSEKPGSAGFKEMLEILTESLVSWNLEDENDQPVPLNAATLVQQEDKLVGAILQSWQTTQAGVSAPLDGASSSGGTSPVPQIPMTPMDDPSQSLAS